MTYYREAMSCFDKTFGGLRGSLENNDFMVNESSESDVIKLFKAAGGGNLLINECYGGLGLSAMDSVLVQIASGALSPSLAIASCMHHFSVATLQEMVRYKSECLEQLLLKDIAKNKWLVASAFCEGVPFADVLDSRIIATPHKEGYLISGIKEPCSLAYEMDLLSASVKIDEGDNTGLFVAILHKNIEGLSVRPYWKAPFFQASQSESIVLENVYVPKDMLSRLDVGAVDDVSATGYIWFEILLCASYLGMAYGLLEKVNQLTSIPQNNAVLIYGKLESSAMLLTAIATDSFENKQELLGKVFLCRYSLQKSIIDTVNKIVSFVGGINYLNNPCYAMLVQAIQAFNFHPPGNRVLIGNIIEYINNPVVEVRK